MKVCEHFEDCGLFKEIIPMTCDEGIFIIRDFCKGDFEACARYRVYEALGEHSVDRYLLPAMSSTADKIINMNIVEVK
jgi:hypothetical protein